MHKYDIFVLGELGVDVSLELGVAELVPGLMLAVVIAVLLYRVVCEVDKF
jgi:hypothetical protein